MMHHSDRSLHIALLVIAVVCGIWLHYDAVSSRHGAMASLEHEANRMAQLLEERTPSRRILDLRQRIDRSTATMHAEMTSLIDALTTHLGAMDVVDRSLNIGATERHGDLDRAPVNVTFRGSFVSACEFASRIHSHANGLRPRRLTIAHDRMRSHDALQISFTLDAYALRGERSP